MEAGELHVLFHYQLDAMVQWMYCLLLDNIKAEMSPILVASMLPTPQQHQQPGHAPGTAGLLTADSAGSAAPGCCYTAAAVTALTLSPCVPHS